MKKLAILASGSGTNAENILKFFANGNRVRVELVIYDRKNAAVAERMRPYGVDTLYLPREVWNERPAEIVALLKEKGIDLVVLAGFLRVIPSEITSAFTGRMINIHPSLLPAYGGMGMYGIKVHQAVIAAGEKRSGVTVHYVSDDVDSGEILMQQEVEIADGETPESLEQKIHAVEYSLFPRAIVAALRRIESTPPQYIPAPTASIDQSSESMVEPTATESTAQAPVQASAEMPVDVETEPESTYEISLDKPDSLTATSPHDSSSEEVVSTDCADIAGNDPAKEWADTLGVNYDPSKLPPHYPGAEPPAPIRHDNHLAAAPASASASSPASGSELPEMPKNYLVWSVVMTVLCCLPAGVVAIIFSSQVTSKYYAGDYEGAHRASERAQIWIIVSFVLGVLANTLYIPLSLLG